MKIISSIFFLVISITVFGQEIVDKKITQDEIIHDSQLAEEQYAAWDKIKKNWYIIEFKKILKENKLKITDCTGKCDEVYMDVILKINENGKLEYYKFLTGTKCNEDILKPFEIRMMKDFFKMEFPAELKNTKFKTRLGHDSKC